MTDQMNITEQLRVCLRDVPLGTRLKHQEILDRVAAVYGADAGGVIPDDYCYNTAGGEKNGGVNFFLHIRDDAYAYVGEHYTGRTIPDVLCLYRADFARIWAEERYKWEAVRHYKRTWNLEAPDFAAMLAEAFSRAGNLLAGAMYYPYKMITLFARRDPETVRAMFRRLYDETRPLSERYQAFRASCDLCLAAYRGESDDLAKIQNHYQDLRAVSVYLSFEYPDTYFLYKYKMYASFRDLIGFQEDPDRDKSEIWKLENYHRLCGEVLGAVKGDAQLLQMQKEALDSQCWPDEACHLLVQTVIYAGSSFPPLPSLSPPDIAAGEGTAPDAAGTATDIGKNTILYGPPGTGKTYHTVLYAVAAVENRPLKAVERESYGDVLVRYHQYRAEGLIAFTTFHQSYSYEEFIEGIRPVLAQPGKTGDVQYRIENGVFLQFCQPLQNHVNDFHTAWELLCLDAQAQGGKYSFFRRTGSEISAVLVDSTRFRVNWEGGKGNHNDLRKAAIQKQFAARDYAAREQLSGGNRWMFDAQQAVIDTLTANYDLADRREDTLKNRVFIIDEINRGNISKIFGELITLIEPSRRIGQRESTTVRLPYSKREFGVPDNLYLIGTMNTADRSIAVIDTALRRRFQFREMQPDPQVLAGIRVEDLSIRDMFVRMNEKISALYDREHTVGHAYFMPLLQSPTIETLAEIFENSIIPLLQEYFYDDYEKIRLVLGDNKKQAREHQFITAGSRDCAGLFGSADLDLDESVRYEINRGAFDNIEAYRSI